MKYHNHSNEWPPWWCLVIAIGAALSLSFGGCSPVYHFHVGETVHVYRDGKLVEQPADEADEIMAPMLEALNNDR